MKKKLATRLILVLTCTFLVQYIHSQNENNIWSLNLNNLLNFNTTPPTIIETNNFLFTEGQSASVCDDSGDLLFYTNGTEVINRLHESMPNGRLYSVTNHAISSALVVPMAESPDRYYLFTLLLGIDNLINYTSATLSYSIVDMTLNNGLGGVVSQGGETVIPLRTNLADRLVAAKGECGAIWIVTHEINSNRYVAFETTASGISPPVISEVGTFLTNNVEVSLQGFFNFSFDYKNLINTGGSEGFAEILSFDPKTGQFSNPIPLAIENNTNLVASACFSPDNSKLYLIEIEMVANRQSWDGSIFQYDLFDFPKTPVTKNLLIDLAFRGSPNLQVGPNGIIYLNVGEGSIGTLTNPNDIINNVVFTDSVYSAISQVGTFSSLQNLVVPPSKPILKDSLLLPLDTRLCPTTPITLQLQAEGDSYRWQDGDTTSTYQITAPGTYWVDVQKGNCTFTDTLQVFPSEPLADLGKDTTLCLGDSLQLTTNTTSNYQWQDGSSQSTFTVKTAGLYWVEKQDSLCPHQDSVLVAITELSTNLPEDTSFCAGQNVFLDVTQTGATYRWQDGSTGSILSVRTAGTYSVDLQKDNCSLRDSIRVTVKIDQPFLPNDTVLCNASNYLIVPDTAFSDITWWQAPLSGDSLLVTESGTYFAIPANDNCGYSDSITVLFETVAIALSDDTTLCTNDDLLLDVGPIDGTLNWQDGSTDQQFLVTESGTYSVNLTRNGCSVSDSIQVVLAPLTFDLGADTTICTNETLTLTVPIDNANYAWTDGQQTQSIQVTESGIYEVEVTQNNCTSRDNISITVESPPSVTLGNDTTICTGETLILAVPENVNNYQWQDGSSTSTQTVTQSGPYKLTGTIDNCQITANIQVNMEDCPSDQLCQMYLPNSFSPNGDGFNDALQVLTDCELQFFAMEVYDRWGNLVFATNDSQQTWDGTYNGQSLDQGVYLWTVQYQFVGQRDVVVETQTATIIR
ncbi:MAG: gliding motility-associated C-terminal domain-containing protein [Bacteroidota bacterium]